MPQVLPKRLEIDIPPSVGSVAEAAVGRDTIMRAVASAVLQADAVEQVGDKPLEAPPHTPRTPNSPDLRHTHTTSHPRARC